MNIIEDRVNFMENNGNFMVRCFICYMYKKLFKCLKLWKMNENGEFILDSDGNRQIGYICLNCVNLLKLSKKNKCLFCNNIDEGICNECKEKYYVKSGFL